MIYKEGAIMFHLLKKDKKTSVITTATPHFKKYHQESLGKA